MTKLEGYVNIIVQKNTPFDAKTKKKTTTMRFSREGYRIIKVIHSPIKGLKRRKRKKDKGEYSVAKEIMCMARDATKGNV
jgi:hypothetical protein